MCHDEVRGNRQEILIGTSDSPSACYSGNQEVYDRLGVRIIERGESFYQPFMPEVVRDLEDRGG